MGIAEATATPSCHQQLIPLVGEVAQQDARASIADFGAAGHLDHEVVATGSGAAIRTAPAAINGLKDPLVLEVQQGLEVAVSEQQHVGSSAAIPAGWAACWHVFLAAKRHDSIPAAASLDGNPGLINELHYGQT